MFLNFVLLELARTKQTGQPSRDYRYVDIFREKPMKVVVKVMVPIKEYPKVIE